MNKYTDVYLRSFFTIVCVVVCVAVVCKQVDKLGEESILDLLPSKRVHQDTPWHLVEFTDDSVDEINEGVKGDVGSGDPAPVDRCAMRSLLAWLWI
jgi:hypothetical protein